MSKPPANPAPISNTDRTLQLLASKNGASIDEIVAATGWKPHSARAVMSGLKKKGHVVTREKVDGASRYRITGGKVA